MNLGENIHNYRISNNMSQTDLANALEVSRQSVSKWENNSAQPELDKLCKMSNLFDITLDELVYGRANTLKSPQGGERDLITTPLRELFPSRVFIGATLLLFGMVFFLMSVFLGDHLRMGEVMGEFLSVNIVVLSLALLFTYHTGVLSGCMIVYFLYNVICFGFFKEISLTNYLFMVLAGVVLLVWFLIWGMHGNAQEERANALRTV